MKTASELKVSIYPKSGDVTVDSFLSVLRGVMEGLKAFDDESAKWLVAETRKYNPTVIVLRRSMPSDFDPACRYVQEISAISRTGSDSGFLSDAQLKAQKDFAATTSNGVLRVELDPVLAEPVNVDLQCANQIDHAESERNLETIEEGFVRGRLERLDLHNKKMFTLYSDFDGSAIKCFFNDDQLERIASNIQHTPRAEVMGLVGYGRKGQPRTVRNAGVVKWIPPDCDLPSLAQVQSLGVVSLLSTESDTEEA